MSETAEVSAPHGVHCGDCVEWLGTLADASVDLVFADPPFNINYEYDVYDDRRSDEDYLNFCRAWISGTHRVLKPDGTFWLAIGDEYAAQLKLLSQELGFHCRSWVIWYYTFGVNSRKGFSRSHTHLFHFVKDPKRFTFNIDNPAVRIASARQLVYADKRANTRGRLPDNTWILRPQDSPAGGFEFRHDTWFFSRVAGTFKEREGFHGCQMPEQLLGRIVRLCSRPGELVIDPFGGSGTTLAVAKKLGRRYAASELSPEYAQRIESRLDACNPGDDLDGAEDAVRSAPKTNAGRTRADLVLDREIDLETRADLRQAWRLHETGGDVMDAACDPEFLDAIDEHFRTRKQGGDLRVWLTQLQRVEADLDLSQPTPSPTEFTQRWSMPAEAALRLVALDFGLTVPECFACPEALAGVDELAMGMAGIAGDPRDHAASLRRAALAAFRQTSGDAADSRISGIGQSRSLDAFLKADSPSTGSPSVGGAFMIANAHEKLYAGTSSDIRKTLQVIQGNSHWQAFEPKKLWLVENEDPAAAQSTAVAWKRKFQPFLNLPMSAAKKSPTVSDAEIQPTLF
ncbi:MAG: site-specific DNA-methyltransferase [Planctomycetota bacterium]